jgi:hypothetical protein
MARAPRAHVPKTSGQGISRLSYQKTRNLTEDIKASGIKMPAKEEPPKKERYAKSKPSEAKMNVDYANTFKPRNLKDVEELGALRPPKSQVKLGLTKGKRPK